MELKPYYTLKIQYLTPETIAIFIDGKLSSIIGINKAVH